MKKNKIIGYSSIFLTILIWGFDNVLIKSVLGDITPWLVILIRFIVVSASLGIVTLFQKPKGYLKEKDYRKKVIIMGILLVCLYSFITNGLHLSTATIMEFVNSGLGSIITIIVLTIFLTHERETLKNKYVISALIVATLGTAFTSNLFVKNISFDIGVLYIIIGGIFFSFYTMIFEKIDENKKIENILRDSSIIAAIIMTIFLATIGQLSPITTIEKAPLIKIIMFSLLIDSASVFTYYKAVRLISGVKVNILILICPIITYIIAYLFLGETVTTIQLIGCILLFTSSILIGIKEYKELKANK